MKKLVYSFLVLNLIATSALAQDSGTSKGMYKRQQAIGVSFVLNDYKTAQNIRSHSLASVINNKSYSKVNQMSPGIAITYFKGLHNKIDFAGTLAGSFVDNPRPNATTSDN